MTYDVNHKHGPFHDAFIVSSAWHFQSLFTAIAQFNHGIVWNVSLCVLQNNLSHTSSEDKVLTKFQLYTKMCPCMLQVEAPLHLKNKNKKLTKTAFCVSRVVEFAV